jgi:hypothetical protein
LQKGRQIQEYVRIIGYENIRKDREKVDKNRYLAAIARLLR